MKKQLLKKISSFIVTAMLFSVSANAQIVYTDVNPDFVKTCSTSASGTISAKDSIDINSDGVFDLELNLGVSLISQPRGYIRSGFVRATPINGSEIITDSAGYPYPLYMQMNDVISTSSSTSTVLGLILISRSKTQVAGSATATGNWISTTEGYLGLKIVSGGQSYYSWIRMNVEVITAATVSATFTIKDYAYNSIPNQSILAGQTTATGINENSFGSSINLFPNPATNHLTIDLGSKNKKVEVSITDLTGKIIYTTTTDDTDKIEMSTDEFAEGIYIVKIKAGQFIETKKLVVKK